MTHTPEQLAEHLRRLNEVGVDVMRGLEVLRASCHEIDWVLVADDGDEEKCLCACGELEAADALFRRCCDVVREGIASRKTQEHNRACSEWADIGSARDPLAAAVDAAVRLRGKAREATATDG